MCNHDHEDSQNISGWIPKKMKSTKKEEIIIQDKIFIFVVTTLIQGYHKSFGEL